MKYAALFLILGPALVIEAVTCRGLYWLLVWPVTVAEGCRGLPPMGLLDRRNPKATLPSLLLRAIQAAVAAAVVFFLAFKPAWREALPITLPLWCLLCALVGVLVEWQVPRGADDESPEGG